LNTTQINRQINTFSVFSKYFTVEPLLSIQLHILGFFSSFQSLKEEKIPSICNWILNKGSTFHL